MWSEWTRVWPAIIIFQQKQRFRVHRDRILSCKFIARFNKRCTRCNRSRYRLRQFRLVVPEAGRQVIRTRAKGKNEQKRRRIAKKCEDRSAGTTKSAKIFAQKFDIFSNFTQNYWDFVSTWSEDCGSASVIRDSSPFCDSSSLQDP